MSHRTPSNSAIQSDQRYWYLREVQELIQVPVGEARSEFRTTSIIDTSSGDPIVFGDVSALPGTDRVAALAADGGAVHLLDGVRLVQSFKIRMPQAKARRICASDEFVFIAFEAGRLARLPIYPLLQDVANQSASSEVLLDALPVRYTQLMTSDSFDLSFRRMIALRANGSSRLMFYGSRVADLSVVAWSTPDARLQKVEVICSQYLADSAWITDACVSQRDGLVYLTDGEGGRVLRLDPEGIRMPVKVLAGDGVKYHGERPQFGATHAVRLGELQGICEFHVPPQLAEQLSKVVLPLEPPEWARRGFVRRGAGISHERIAKVIEENSGFLVVFDATHRAALTISLQTTGSKRDAVAGRRCTWPLLPAEFSSPAASPWVGEQPTRHLEHRRVCVGPATSLLFWKPNDTEVGIYTLATSALSAQANEQRTAQELARLSAQGKWTES